METEYKCVTLEDLYGEITEEEYWDRVAQMDKLECSIGCMKDAFGYHTRSCPRQSVEDARMEQMSEAQVDMAFGK